MDKKVNCEHDHEGLILHKEKYNKTQTITEEYNILYSNKFADEGIELILENNLTDALKRITEALSFNPNDHRHYLNRCYCYLRMSKYALALADAEYVIKKSKKLGHLFVAKIRAGQASFALEKYRQAEIYLKQATDINSENYHARRELMRIRVARIVNMGFKEKDAILALEKYPTVLGAVNHLSESHYTFNSYNPASCLQIEHQNYDDMIYASDEDEKSNNVEIINKILNYEPSKVKLQHIMAKPSTASFLTSTVVEKNDSANLNTERIPRSNKQAIWIGNLTNEITDKMLINIFQEFGKITSVYRPFNASYAFLNFEKEEHVKSILSSGTYIVAGITLAIRSANAQ